jgi:hypothetical protein
VHTCLALQSPLNSESDRARCRSVSGTFAVPLNAVHAKPLAGVARYLVSLLPASIAYERADVASESSGCIGTAAKKRLGREQPTWAVLPHLRSSRLLPGVHHFVPGKDLTVRAAPAPIKSTNPC